MKNTKKVFLFFILSIHTLGKANELIAKFSFEEKNNLTYIKVKVNDSAPLDFIFDTGANGIGLNSRVAEELKYSSSETTITGGGGELYDTGTLKSMNLNVGGITLKKDIKIITGFRTMEMMKGKGFKIDGVIGFDIFDQYVVKIDHQAHMIELYSFDKYKYADKGEKCSLEIINGIPFVSGKFIFEDKSKFQDKFEIDTGCTDSLVVKNEKNIFDTYFIKKDTSSAMGSDGKRRSISKGSVKGKFTFGDFEIIPSNVQLEEFNPNKPNFIGNAFLKNFNIVFDYSRRLMYLEQIDKKN